MRKKEWMLLYCLLIALFAGRVSAQNEMRMMSVDELKKSKENGMVVNLVTANNHRYQKPGFIFLMDMASSVGNDASVFDLNMGLSYLITPHVSVGVGAGMNVYAMDKESIVAMPFYGQLQLFTSKKKNTPFVDFRAGYAFDFADLVTSKEGVYLSPSVGYRMVMAPAFAIYFSLGFTYQGHRGNAEDLYEITPYSAITRAATFRFGVCF